MARLDGRFIKGTAGPVVYKNYRDLQVVQSKPEFSPGSQTKKTKLAASSFGLAAKLAMNIRKKLDPIIGEFFDGPMVNRMNSDAIYIMGQAFNPETKIFTFNTESFSRLGGFEFNLNSPVRDNFFVQPEVSIAATTLKVKIPVIHLPHELKFPKDGRICSIGLAVAMFDLKHGRMMLNPVQTMTIKWSFEPVLVPAQTFDFEIEPGCLCIVAMCLQYTRTTFAGTLVVNTKAFNPAAILKGLIAEGVPEKSRTKDWEEMDFKTD